MKLPTTFKKAGVYLLLAASLSACESGDEATVVKDNDNTVVNERREGADVFKLGVLPDTQGGTDAEGQAHASLHPMDEVLKHLKAEGVDMVLVVGDLSDKASEVEYAEWRSVADAYLEEGMEFLPILGNHETSWSSAYNWVENMKDYIPKDAIHMPGYEWSNYYVIRENVLIFGITYYGLPLAFEWIKESILANEDKVDHIVVSGHDGLIGAKYGLTREQIVDGTKDDDWVYAVQPEIRRFFSEHDVIYVQGHDHQYQRSLITAKTVLQTYPSSSTPTGGNYRMDAYTQIISGNASYKGYEFRYGERDLVQAIVSQKNKTDREDDGYDVNSSVFTFTNDRVDYESYYANHHAHSNAIEEDFTADWKLLDKFSRTTNRCETLVYPNSIHPDTRAVMVLQPEYLSNDCYADDGSSARLAGGKNDTFNRTDTRERSMGFTPGITRAESVNDLLRLAYQWLFQVHERWSPNLNAAYRVVPDYENEEIIIPETTIDLKEHVTLSWTPADGTATDILIVSGTQNQTGMYQDDYGVDKDIEVDAGLPFSLSGPDLNAIEPEAAKPVVALPAYASKSWDISDAVSDPYTVVFTAPETVDAATVQLAIKGTDWEALAPAECVIDAVWDETFLMSAPERPDACADYPLLGYDSNIGNKWWVVLHSDAELSLISK